MKLAFVIFIIINIRLIKSTNIDDTSGGLFYEELGCRPVHSFLPFLPTKYNCPKFKQAQGVCLNKGITYQDGEIINGTCRCNSCYCSSAKNKPGQIICSRAKCPPLTVQKPCWKHYDLNDCCPKKCFCPHETMEQCSIRDEVCYEGQYIRPRNTCWECVCEKGFKLYNKKFCRRVRCDLEINHYDKLANGCVPLYKTSARDKALCCPSNFICAKDITSINTAAKSFLQKLKHYILKLFRLAMHCDVCGEAVSVGDEFKLNLKGNRQVHCSCLTPPFPRCVEY